MKLKAVFFDNDGVLIDTEPYYFEANRQLLAEYQYTLSITDYIRISLDEGTSPLDILKEKLSISADELAQMRHRRDQFYENFLASTPRVLPGVVDLLSFLKNKVRLGIVTTSQKRHFELAHRHTGLREYFDFEITREDVVLAKPDPEPYLKALSHAGLHPEETMVIEDSFRGLKSAASARIPCVVIPTAYTQSQDFSLAYRVCHQASDLIPHLKSSGYVD